MTNPHGEVMDPESWQPPRLAPATPTATPSPARAPRSRRVSITVEVPDDVDVIDVRVNLPPANDDARPA